MSPPHSTRLLRVLLIDDQPADRDLTEEAFRRHHSLAQLHVLPDPHDTLTWLREQAAQAALPDVILLDLNMPGCDGLTVLDTIRRDPTFHAVRIVVLAHSSEEEDVTAAYNLGATTYLVKPSSFSAFERQMQILVMYWHRLCCLPTLS